MDSNRNKTNKRDYKRTNTMGNKNKKEKNTKSGVKVRRRS